MIPDNCLLAKCPHCGKEKELLQLVSGNTFGAENWSDAKRIAPMLPQVSPVQRCPHCGRFYLLSKAKTKDGDHKSFETGWLAFDEVMASHKDLGKLDSEEISTVALVTLWAFNDIYRNGGVPTNEQIEMFQAYMQPLMKGGGLFEEELLNAEVYRELGRFEECLKILTDLKPDNEYIAFIADEIRQRAIKKEKQVFLIDYKPKPRHESYEAKCETKSEGIRRKGFWQKVREFLKDVF